MTEKLYYKDSYIKSFSANLLSVFETEKGIVAVLDKTAFFPEEGGQSADKGYIGGIRVLDVWEENGTVYHLIDGFIEENITVECTLDFDERFEKMQLHTAEHMACGIIHKLYGFENVGFHLGLDEVVFDVSGVMTREMLDKVELEVNKAVFENRCVSAEFPTPDELAVLEYRSKLEIASGVRVVFIDGVDACACCAPHVNYTAEVGIVKFLDFEKHRGGTRIRMTAGMRALLDYRKRYESIKEISGLLSVPQTDVSGGVKSLIEESSALKKELKESEISLAKMLAESTCIAESYSVHFLGNFSVDALREFCNVMSSKTNALVVAVSGVENDYRYVMVKRDSDVSGIVKAANSQLSGRGGGRGGMAQGSFYTTKDKIEEYFK